LGAGLSDLGGIDEGGGGGSGIEGLSSEGGRLVHLGDADIFVMAIAQTEMSPLLLLLLSFCNSDTALLEIKNTFNKGYKSY
jgi:hypothetical protein